MSNWKHTTAGSIPKCSIVGIDLFDDEQEGYVSIYQRYEDGTRFPARTVSTADQKHYLNVMLAWLGTGMQNFDYRKNPCDLPEITQRLERKS